jgi:hypothetical protein
VRINSETIQYSKILPKTNIISLGDVCSIKVDFFCKERYFWVAKHKYNLTIAERYENSLLFATKKNSTG